MRSSRSLIASLSMVLGALTVASAADAQTACPAGAILVRGSSASEPIITRVAALAKAENIDIVYNSSGGSCTGVQSLIPAPTLLTTDSGKTKFDTANPNATCNLTARAADIGVSDVYSSSCTSIGSPATPADVVDYIGPVQAFVLAVYDDPSFPVAISSEAAFNVFGITARNGNASFGVDPWKTQADVLSRNETSGTQQTWARQLGIPITKFGQNDQGGASQLLGKINSSPRNSVIGILAINDIVPIGTPPVQPKVRPLAFKAKGQDFAYYTSSTSTAQDMINVRDGHYAPWANLHFFAKGTGGVATDAKVKRILELLETKEAVSTVAKARAVPNCAMHVKRTSDQGDFAAFTPAKPCGCYFEAEATGTAPSTCKTCTDDGPCGTSGQCVYGYCEAK